MFAPNYANGVEQMWESPGHAYTYSCIYTFLPRCGTRRGVTAAHMKTIQGCPFAHYYAKGVEQRWGVRWTCIRILIHVHTLAGPGGSWGPPLPSTYGNFFKAKENNKNNKNCSEFAMSANFCWAPPTQSWIR